MIAEHTICITDDDVAFADSLSAVLQVKGYRTRTYGSALEFLESYERVAPTCLLLDVRMPGMSGLELLDRLNADGSLLPVILLTGHGDISMAVKAMQAGAADFIEKPVDKNVLFDAIDRAVARATETAAKSAEVQEARSLVAQLSPREHEVLQHLIMGGSNKAIAVALGISPRTVEMHRTHLMLKMRTKSLSHLIRLGLAAGAVSPGP